MARLGLLRRWVIPCLLALGASAAANAQVDLSVSPLQLNFLVPAGAISAAKNLDITTSIPTTIIVQVLTGTEFINVQTGPVNVLGMLSLPVRINASNLAPGAYQGTIRLSTANQQVTVTIAANVGGITALTASPSTLNFTALEGASAGSPASSTVFINSSAGTLTYTVTSSTNTGGNWLVVGAISGTTGGSGIPVSVNPSSLAPGTYTGSILVESTSTPDAVQISVTLSVGSGSTLSVSPNMPPTFLYQIGGATPAPQTLIVSSSAGNIPFSVAESPDVSWLSVTPLSGTAGTSPVSITLTIHTAGLVAGSYNTNLVVTPLNGTPLPAIPINLAVSASPLLQVSRTTLSFSSTFNGPIPASQQVNITAAGTGGPIGFNITGGAIWLSASPISGTTPASVTVSVNPASLGIGTHNATLTVRPSNGDQYFTQILVSFTILDRPKLIAAPGALLFSHQTSTSPPQSQTFQLTSNSQPIAFTAFAATTNCGPGWLNVSSSQGTTPASVSVSVLTTGLSPGICSGNIEVRYNAGLGLESIVVPVTAAISGSPELRVALAPGFGQITITQGGSAAPQSLTLSSTDLNTPLTFTMVASSQGGPWLVVPPNGTTPAQISALIQASGLEPGAYSGQITIGSPSLSTNFIIPVSLTVVPEISVFVSPQSFTFSQAQGGSPSPAQTLSLLSTGGTGATFSAAITQITGGDWLQINRSSGTASGDITVSIKPNALPQGTYTSRITLSFSNSISQPVQIPVTLIVSAAQTISASVQRLTFNYQTGGTLPPSQTFNITGSPGPSNFTVGTVSSGWLSVNSQSGTTPAQITASVNITGLAVGSYSGTITITAPGAAASPLSIPVTLNIAGPPPPVIDSAGNNASNQPGGITGGELLTLKGTFLPPGVPEALFSLTPQGTIAATLNGVRVLFDGIPGTPIYVSRTQVNVIAPYEILSRAFVQIVLEYQGVPSAGFSAQVQISAPGIYTLDSTGFGQAAALNANGTFNGPLNGGVTVPGAPGATIVVYISGGGQTNPQSATGTVTPTNRLFPILGTVTAEIGGLPARVDFIGGAPGLVAGVVQANLTPNPNVHGNAAVRITINGNTSPLGTTVTIQ